MKIGDLVTLSAAGQERIANWPVRKGFGIIVKMAPYRKYPIQCMWPRKQGDNKRHDFKRYELKKVKKSS